MSRYRTVRPAVAGHVVPVPGRAFALDAAGEPVDSFDGYWKMALADGSVVEVAPAQTPPAASAPTHPPQTSLAASAPMQDPPSASTQDPAPETPVLPPAPK